jgi:hypothetical protein
MAQQLHPIANSQDGDAHFQKSGVTERGILPIDAGRSPGKNHPLRRQGFHLFYGNMIGMNFAIDLAFADPSRNQLGILGTKIEDEYLIEVGF